MNPKGSRERRQVMFEDSVRAKQSNTIWPDTVLNGRTVDALLWHGSPTAPRIQKAGAFVFGIAFLVSGIFFVHLAVVQQSPFVGVFGAFFVLLGFRVCFKIFAPTKLKPHSSK